jgi:tRNA nucleotidyltransferase (CCA-adding enzyme)
LPSAFDTLASVQLLVTHTSPDFDGVSSLALAKLLHPGGVAVLQGSIPEAMQRVLELYRDTLELGSPEGLELKEVTELIVVDTSEPKRITPFDSLLGSVPITVYDHHPRDEDAIPAGKGIHREVGATATILTLLLKAQNLTIPAPIASLALLGIHDDTGNLRYSATTAEDYEAAAYLLTQGASLEFVQTFLRDHFEEEHRDVFAAMLESAHTLDIEGHVVVTASLQTETYLPGLAPLCNELLEFYTAEAAFTFVHSEEKTFVIARSRSSFNVASALAEAFGGGGHVHAGFAKTTLSLTEAEAKLLEVLPYHTTPQLTAKDVMSTPVKTIRDTATLSEAQSLLIHFGHNGVPVLDANNSLVGMLSRRDLDKARHHALAEEGVASLMSKHVIQAEETTKLSDLEHLMIEHSIGRIPIMRDKLLVGIVTRTDLIRAKHQRKHDTQAEELLSRLPQATLQALERAQAHVMQGALYLVGGTVRDLLLGASIQDCDLVVEGSSAKQLARNLQQELGGNLTCHEAFDTCTLEFENGLLLDIATARDEFYAHPGALPSVTPGTLQQDLARRDFSINTLAIRLVPQPVMLLDMFQALEDLKAKQLRILHPFSFSDDPTRIVRGARLAGRLNFSWENETKERIASALESNILKRVSPSRFRTELELTLQETRVTPALEVLADCNAFSKMFGMTLNKSLLENLDTLRQDTLVSSESYLLALLFSVPEHDLKDRLETFGWPLRYQDTIKRLRTIQSGGVLSSDTFTKLNEAEKAVIRAVSPALDKRVQDLTLQFSERRLTGKDVLDLGLKPGPQVGRILAEVARARDEGLVKTFDDELELAQKIVQGST